MGAGFLFVIQISKVDDPKAPFSIATKPKYRGVRYSFPWIGPLTLDLHLIILSVKVLSKEESSSLFFLVFGLTRPRIEPRFSGSLANTLLK